jgi:dTMP kinase
VVVAVAAAVFTWRRFVSPSMLITLEGLDGSGKSSAVDRLRESDGVPEDTVFTREPTSDTWYGEPVHESIARDDADSLAELFLYTADHAAHLADTVRPALEDGHVVVSDRYSDSRYAYQGATLSDYSELTVPDALEYVRALHQPWTRPPDATIYLDVDPETGARRAGVTNKLERVDFLAAVAENYEWLIEDDSDRFFCVDAERPQAAVLDEIEEVVTNLVRGQ